MFHKIALDASLTMRNEAAINALMITNSGSMQRKDSLLVTLPQLFGRVTGFRDLFLAITSRLNV
jgi:hypothetical protein